MIAKIHKTDDKRLVLAVCDSDVLGKKFEEGNKQLDLSSDFYKGDEMSEKEISDIMRNSYMLNLVGKKSTDLAIKEGIISKDNIKTISGIPYANATME